ncbi:MAG: copper ion binding protein [Prevotella sp.]|nr:copper ion binding protein [Prevotella sp.]
MKKKIFLTIAACGLFTAAFATGTDTLVVRIKGMRCEECAHKVGTVLKKIDGFERASYDFEKRTASIIFDAQRTCADTIKSRLTATGRYKPTEYDANEVIRRGMGLQISDMHCQKCAERITKRISQVEGVDSIAPHLDKHYVFFRYDANKTSKAEIREILAGMGYTPVTYYTSKNISFAYFIIPKDKANEETIEAALALDGVDDANVNMKRTSLAITYVNNETSPEKLIQGLKEAGIKAEVPKPHECKE